MREIIFITAMSLFSFILVGGVVLFHDPSALGQPIPPGQKPISDIEKKFDATINRAEDKVTTIEQSKTNAKPTHKTITKIVYRDRKVYVSPPKQETIYFMRDSTVAVELNVRREAGAFFVDMNKVDSIEKVQEQAAEKPYYDVRDTVVEQARDNINFWEKVIKVFKRKN